MQHLTLMLFLTLSISACSKSVEEPQIIAPVTWTTERVIAANTRQVIFQSQIANDKVSFHLFLPDEYQSDPNQSFPVLYWLHGTGGGLEGIPILVDFFKTAMENNKIRPMIIVFPNGLPNGMWCNSKNGKQPVEDVFIHDLISYIDTHYRTIPSRKGRIVEGFSMGGYGAGRLGLKYYDLFGGFSMIAGGPLQLDFNSNIAPQNIELQKIVFKDVYGNDMSYFEAQSPWRLAEQFGPSLPNPTPKRIIIGNSDFTYQANLDFHNHLDQQGIPHQYFEFNGIGHNTMALLNAMGEGNWSFYRAVFD